MIGEECLIEAIRDFNDGTRETGPYLHDKLQDVEVAPAAGTIGESVDCDRCGAIFRFNPGGVYLELEGKKSCDRPDGATGGRYSYQLNVQPG